MFAIIVGLGLALAQAPQDKPDAQTEAKIKVLMKERRDLLKKALDARTDEYKAGRATLDSLLDVAKRLLRAELDVAERVEARVTAWSGYLDLMKAVEKLTLARYDVGQATEVDLLLARVGRREAEIGWLKAGGKEAKAKDK